MIRKKYLAITVVLSLITIAYVATVYSLAIEAQQIPFPGMSMTYQVYSTYCAPPLFSRMVTFYLNPTDADYIWVRDSENLNTLSDDRVSKIDVRTRKIVWADSPSGDVQVGGYSEALFPIDLHVGDEVPAYWGGNVTIVGSQRMSVMGQRVDAWVAYTPTEWDGIFGNYTMNYEKKTGIWLGGNVVWTEGETLHSWVMQLESTNAPI